MERNRDSRRGTVAAVNGGLSRRRQRSSSLRDSPEEDGGMEMAEPARLRDRGIKKDRDRDRERSNRNKRRRGERMHHGSSRDEGDESSEESLDEEEEEEDDDDVAAAVRLPPPPPPPPNPLSSSSSLQQNHHHNHHHHHHNSNHQQQRKSFPPGKVGRAPTPSAWKADDMIGVSVPRKARSASTKRSPECWVSGAVGCGSGSGSGSGGGGGGGEHVPRQPSTSPSRLSPASTSQISPSSSNATSLKKKMKPMSGGTKHRPPKISKSSPLTQDDIEIEVAEVLYGMTRQFQPPTRQETHKPDTKEANGASAGEPKSSVSSPNLISQSPLASQPSVLPPSNSCSNPSSMPIVAPRRKRPRPVKFEDESPTSPVGLVSIPSTSVSSASKMEMEHQTKAEASSPRLEKNMASSATENGSSSIDVVCAQVAVTPMDAQLESAKMEAKVPVSDLKPVAKELEGGDQTDGKGEADSSVKETIDVNITDASATKTAPASDGLRGDKFCIDLMAPPPGKLSPERDDFCDSDAEPKSLAPVINMMPKMIAEEKEEAKATEKMAQSDEAPLRDRMVEKSTEQEFDIKKQAAKEKTLDLQIDLEKPDKDSLNPLSEKQLPKAPKMELKQEKSAPASSPSMPKTIPAWPGIPPFGYMGQLPSLQPVVPMEGAPGSSNIIQTPNLFPPLHRIERCATHCYIAKCILYHQRLTRMNSFWPTAAAGNAPLFGAKPPYNLNAVPPSDAALLGNSVAGRNLGSLQDTKGTPMVAAFPGYPPNDKIPPANNTTGEAAQRKQLVLQQTPQSAPATTMMHGPPAFLFPINQQQAAAAAAAAVAAAATRSGAAKSTPGAGNGAPSASASSSTVVTSGAGGQTTTMNLSFAGLPPNLPPNEAQYLTFLQNNGYPYPIPAPVASAPHYRGASPAQPMPFFNGSFYSSQMLHPSQLQQPQPPRPQHPPNQQGHQSTSSGSSSSQKHPQQPQRALGGGTSGTGGNSHGFPVQQHHMLPHQARQQEGDKGLEDNPSTADSRVSQAQKCYYGHNFAVPFHPQNFALMSSAAAAAALSSGGGHTTDKPPAHQHQQQSMQNQKLKVDLSSSQPFAMPFASFGGAGAAPPGLDFSSLAQSHAFFQSHPEAARHGYHQFAMAGVASQASQQKKAAHHQITEDGKPPAVDSKSANIAVEEERKMMASSKAPGNVSQHSLSFSKPNGEPPISSILSNSVVDSSSRTLNLISSPANGSRTASHPSCAPPTATAATSAPANVTHSQQQQHQQHQQHQQMFQLQKQQQQLQMQHHQLASSRAKPAASSGNASIYSERLPAGPAVTKYPQPLPGFPQALIQGGSPTQSPQWKASSAKAAVPTPSPAPSAVKNNHVLQQQSRASQQPLSTTNHQTQISFGVRTTGQHLSGGTSNPSSSAATMGSPSNSLSKSAGGSPRASASGKPGMPTTAISLPQQSSAKGSTSTSGIKSSPVNNRNVPSILGQPQIIGVPNSNSKPQQQQQQQQSLHPQKQQPFSQAQLFFSNAAYIQQAQSPQLNAAAAAAAAAYYQRRPSEPPSQQSQQQQQQQHQQQHQQSSGLSSTGMLHLCPSSLALAGSTATSDPAKAAAAVAAANGLKGLPMPGLLHAAQYGAVAQSASGASHPLIPASFPYMPAHMPPVSSKPSVDQKPAAGNDSLHASWQPEKR